jgi:SMC domain protein
MKIESFSIQNYKCIKDLAVDCRGADGEIRQWTVLLGENNTGKTNVLRALAQLRPEKTSFRTDLDPVFKEAYIPVGVLETSDATVISYVNGERWGYDPEGRAYSEEPFDLHIYGYGVSRYPARTALSEREGNPTETLFNSNARLSDFQEWLLQLDYSQKSGSEKSQKRLEKMHDLVRSDLFPGVTDFSFKKDGDNEHVVVVFSAGKDGDVRFEELGFGYQTTLTWLVDFCKRMFELYPNADNPLQEEAVVLVDEIDLHLHPKWQRDLVPTLSKIFPNVQFIVTTHSPHVLQSMEDVNLYVLRRNAESGEIEAERSNVTNFTGWTVEEILSETMELKEGVRSVVYNEKKRAFEDALKAKDRAQAEEIYAELERMMRPGNPMRSIYRVELEELG